MASAFQINENLHSDVRNRVEARLKTFGFDLTAWPMGSIKPAANPGDVAVFVVVGPTCSSEEVRRVTDAVNSGVPIISIYIDQSSQIPASLKEYGSSAESIDSEELGEVLKRLKTVFKNPSGQIAPKTKTKHNKC